MSIVERVMNAAGGALWTSTTRFAGYVSLKGSAVGRLRKDFDLREVLAEGEIATSSLRISGFANQIEWWVSPDRVTLRHSDGRSTESLRHGGTWLSDEEGLLEQIYICGLGIWTCMIPPLTALNPTAAVEELVPWAENGREWRRLSVHVEAGGLDPARHKTLYVDQAGMPRRIAYRNFPPEGRGLIVYCSAFQTFNGRTIPTLYRALHQPTYDEHAEQTPYLDVEIFDATFA